METFKKIKEFLNFITSIAFKLIAMIMLLLLAMNLIIPLDGMEDISTNELIVICTLVIIALVKKD